MKNVLRPFDINMLYNGNANAPTDIGAAPGQWPDPKAIPISMIFTSPHDRDTIAVAGESSASRAMARDITFTQCENRGRSRLSVQDARHRFYNVQ